MSQSAPTTEATAPAAPPKAKPSLLREVCLWGIVTALLGLGTGAVEGKLLVNRLPLADQPSSASPVILDRILFFGLIGLVLGAIAGLVEWKLKLARAKRA